MRQAEFLKIAALNVAWLLCMVYFFTSYYTVSKPSGTPAERRARSQGTGGGGLLPPVKGVDLTTSAVEDAAGNAAVVVVLGADVNAGRRPSWSSEQTAAAVKLLGQSIGASGSPAQLVVYAAEGSYTGLEETVAGAALDDAAAPRVVRYPASEAAAVAWSAKGAVVARHLGQFSWALLCQPDTLFQTDMVSDMVGGVGTVAVAPSPLLHLFSRFEDPDTDHPSVGICTESDADDAAAGAGSDHASLCPRVHPGIMLGRPSAVLGTVQTLANLAAKVPPVLRKRCGFAELLSRMHCAGSLVEHRPMLHKNAEGLIFDIERAPATDWAVTMGELRVGDGLSVAPSVIAGYRAKLSAKLGTLHGDDQLIVESVAPLVANSTPQDTKVTSSLLTTVTASISESTRSHPDADVDLGTLAISYEQCAKSLTRPRTKTLETLLWLHIPKCGTSLGTVVHGYLCQSEESPHETKINGRKKVCDYCELEFMNAQGTPFWDGKIRDLLPMPEDRKYCAWNVSYRGYFYGHNPLKAQQWVDNRGPGVVALFRDPRKRAVSAWNHAKHTHHLGTKNAESLFPNSRQNLEVDTPAVRDFARHMHVQACQTKMLVGGQCGMYHNLTTERIEEAHRRLKHLAFVGLTDAYNMSVCLFHQMWGGVPQPHMFANARPASAHNAKWKPHKLPGAGMQVRPSEWKTLGPDDDPIDFDTFLLAKSIFISRLREHGLLPGA